MNKKQLKVVEILQNGGHIWLVAGKPYLAIRCEENNRTFTSEPLHAKTFDTLLEKNVIELQEDGKYRLTEAGQV